MNGKPITISKLKELAEPHGMPVVEELAEYTLALLEEITEKDHLEALRKKCERPWIERWRKDALGRELMLPDYGKFLHWLFDQLDAAQPSAGCKDKLRLP